MGGEPKAGPGQPEGTPRQSQRQEVGVLCQAVACLVIRCISFGIKGIPCLLFFLRACCLGIWTAGASKHVLLLCWKFLSRACRQTYVLDVWNKDPFPAEPLAEPLCCLPACIQFILIRGVLE